MKAVLLLLSGPAILIRWLRWLALFQQKEYRFDRLMALLGSTQGKYEFFSRLLPARLDFSRTGLKRPKLTKRMLALALVSLALLVLSIKLTTAFDLMIFAFGVFIIHWLSPVLIFVSNLPFILAKQLYLNGLENRARQKFQEKQPLVIGITGSYGKTTTKDLLTYVLSEKYSVFAPPKSHNHRLSIAQSIIKSYQSQELVVLEYAAYKPGEIHQLTQAYPPDAAIITGLTDQHLAIFGSRDNIVKAKAELVAALKPRDPIFVNGDDQGALDIVEAGLNQDSTNPVFNFCLHDAAGESLEFKKVELDKLGQLQFEWRGQLIQTQLVGSHYLTSVKAVLVAAEYYHLEKEQIIKRLESFEPSEQMVQIKIGSRQEMIIDDGGTSNPEGFKAALKLAEQIKTKNPVVKKSLLITAGLVDLGLVSQATHHQLAKQASTIFDQVCYLGEPGKSQFKAVFGQACLTEKVNILTHYQSLDEQTLVLIEGRIPTWMRKEML